MKKRYLLLLLFFYFALPASGQSVLFVPETFGRDVNGLFNCRLINPYQSQVVSLVITVTERKGGTVCQIKTPEFSMLPGSNPPPLRAARSAAILFNSNKLGQIAGRTRSFPEGDYDYCFEISFKHSDNPPLEQCFSYTLAPFAELNLLDPADKDKICDKRPLLTWQPLIPMIPGARYQLVMAEVKERQSPTEALNYNILLINQANLTAPVLPYPSIAPDLKDKKKYAWQVTAYKDQTILNRSEIWSFTVDCLDSVKKVADNYAYRNIEDLLEGNFYTSTGYIRFAIDNPYPRQQLKYEIRSLDHPDKKIRGLQKQDLLNGRNQIIIDLSGNKAFQKGKYYIMDIRMPNGVVKSLRFLFDEVQ